MLVVHWVLQGIVNCKSSWKRERFVISQVFAFHMPISLIDMILLLALCDHCDVPILATFKRSCRQEMLGYQAGAGSNLSKSLLTQGSLDMFRLYLRMSQQFLVFKRLLLCPDWNHEYHTFLFMIYLHFCDCDPTNSNMLTDTDLWWSLNRWCLFSHRSIFTRGFGHGCRSHLPRGPGGLCCRGWLSPTWLWPSQVGTPKLKVPKSLSFQKFPTSLN